MLDIVLVAPEIPPNAGNVIRLAANSGARLHLVEPLGFSLDDRQLKRAGLDYHDLADLQRHASWADCRETLAGRRLFALTTRGTRRYTDVAYAEGDVLVFGPETRGLPDPILAEFDTAHRLRLPMRAANRSLNLSNAVAVVVYEAWRQLGFAGASNG
ncbi:MAG: tRNA (uridine(34)/cytosine(34)/5-carboxymethylaminomethyluridine(34)-2'-O)-methyltransferase TrmL [Burkholderiales bacterium]|nr:tRNA (uridine(34)/cytosine(34)/5-carboxymethylaminomethyluridine(34)-2'-O)-methyltransferase TrmL [Burkholderiales bacterium]